MQLRAHGETVPAAVTVTDGGSMARLHRPARGVAPGQAVVAYRPDPGGDIVLGSATIVAALPVDPAGVVAARRAARRSRRACT